MGDRRRALNLPAATKGNLGFTKVFQWLLMDFAFGDPGRPDPPAGAWVCCIAGNVVFPLVS